MEKVKVLKTFFVDQSGITYKKGEEADVPKDLADRHTETGFMKIMPPEVAANDKKKTVK